MKMNQLKGVHVLRAAPVVALVAAAFCARWPVAVQAQAAGDQITLEIPASGVAVRATVASGGEQMAFCESAAVSAPLPSPDAAEPVALSVTKSGSTITLNWSGQSANVRVYGSPDKTFQVGVSALASDDPDSSMSFAMPAAALQFYDVNDGTTVSAAARGTGYDPRLSSSIAAAGVTGHWWGDTLTVWGTNLDPVVAENRAEFCFQSVPADSVDPSTGTPTSTAFTIPDDARSTNMTLNIDGRNSLTSNAPYVDLRPPATFSGITSIAYAPFSGKVFVADGVGIHELDIFQRIPVLLRGQH